MFASAPLAVLLALSPLPNPSQPIRNFVRALQRLDLDSALVVASQAVDEHPVWSPDGGFLAINVDEEWSKLDLGSISLIKGTWHGGEGIGVAAPPPALAPLPEAEVRMWEKTAKYGPRKVTTEAGTSLELEQEGFSTIFRITSKGGKPRELWRTSPRTVTASRCPRTSPSWLSSASSTASS